jgi:hypothetical protein
MQCINLSIKTHFQQIVKRKLMLVLRFSQVRIFLRGGGRIAAVHGEPSHAGGVGLRDKKSPRT